MGEALANPGLLKDTLIGAMAEEGQIKGEKESFLHVLVYYCND